ncbi:hypothetical protein KC356_g333 [Hortaea werneckii]|nr:hypothetical protein KC356_g333 [Hortaea werneckii]
MKILQTRIACLGVAADVSGVLPDKLCEVAPPFEVGHVRLRLAVLVGKQVDLAIVKHIGDDRPDVFTLDTGGDVLTVPTTVLIRVVRIGAALCDLLSSRCETIVPLKIRSVGVVLAVQVVVTDHFIRISSRGRGLGGWGSLVADVYAAGAGALVSEVGSAELASEDDSSSEPKPPVHGSCRSGGSLRVDCNSSSWRGTLGDGDDLRVVNYVVVGDDGTLLEGHGGSAGGECCCDD